LVSQTSYSFGILSCMKFFMLQPPTGTHIQE